MYSSMPQPSEVTTASPWDMAWSSETMCTRAAGMHKRGRLCDVVCVALIESRKMDPERHVVDLVGDPFAAEERPNHRGRRAHVRDDGLAPVRFEQRLHDQEVG